MKIRKAVVPIAGLGTRLLPASLACKKEFFPVVGPDGIARALRHPGEKGCSECVDS